MLTINDGVQAGIQKVTSKVQANIDVSQRAQHCQNCIRTTFEFLQLTGYVCVWYSVQHNTSNSIIIKLDRAGDVGYLYHIYSIYLHVV